MNEPTTIRAQVERVLNRARVIAVLGAHVRRHKPAFYVPDYLFGAGYRILPVNPTFLGREAWGEPFRPTLASLDEPVDVVDVFRRSDALEGHLPDILAMEPKPRWVWTQLGVRDDEVASALEAAGIEVIQDRCLLADHQRWSR